MPIKKKEAVRIGLRQYEMLETPDINPMYMKKLESKRINKKCGKLQHW
jgi:hypothetical protein